MRLFRHELKGELLLYTRSRELAFFTFLLPMIFFLLLASVYGNDRIKSEGNVRSAPFLEAGMIGYGIASTAFAGLAITLTIRREQAILKRLRATPLPPLTYVVSVLTSTVLVFALETVALFLLGRAVFGTPFPARVGSSVATTTISPSRR